MEEIRFKLACQTIGNGVLAGHEVVVVDGSQDPLIKKKFTDLGARVFPELHPGLGPCRRQSYFHAVEVCNQGGHAAVLAVEAEKDLAQFVPGLLKPIQAYNAHIVLPERTEEGWASYPEFQVASEKAANAVYDEVMGYKDDMFFGPMLFVPQPEVSGYFLSQPCAKLGFPDTYAHHLGMIWSRLSPNHVKVAKVFINFLYPRVQRDEELGRLNDDMIKKRKLQFDTLTEGYRNAARRLRSPVRDML